MPLTKQDLSAIGGLIKDLVPPMIEDGINRLVPPMIEEGIVRLVSPAFEELSFSIVNINSRLDSMNNRLYAVEQELGQVGRKVDDLTIRVGKLEHKVDSIDGRLKANENDIKELYKMIPASLT